MTIPPAKAYEQCQARGYSRPGLILGYIVLSAGSLASLVVYLFGFVNMTTVDRLLYYALLLALFYCCIAYQLNRFGAAKRALSHRAPADIDLAHLFAEDAPSVAILIPSYREERRVLLMTMLSAALARYSNRRIVLLVDDPPAERASVAATLAAIAEVKRLVDGPMLGLKAAADGWNRRYRAGRIVIAEERRRLAAHYRETATWLDDLAVSLEVDITPEFVHVDRFVIERIVIALADYYRAHADQLAGDSELAVAGIALEYRRLGNLFCTDITSFERKRYDNLSHAPNKAMNLNAYIGLMGGAYDLPSVAGRPRIEAAVDGAGELAIADATYVLTLDADSVILGNYILQLVDILNNNETFGVAQTPYLAFPHSAAPVERIAGATTDIQYLIHQGATFFNASYWVGANALIRSTALKQICREQVEAGKSCKVYIQDETVIEDTGSTIDLLDAGWSVHNHFAALAYSATPGDFGALAIQRKRWSNGGLIIFPMLLKQYFQGEGRLRRIPELLLRSHYLLSPLIGNAAVFMLMVWASADGRALIFTPLVMVPYFTLYGTDLKRLGYRFSDILPVCALNLMLLPVSFAGIAASIRQMVTGRKGSFSRTPKVANRTFIPPYCFLFNGFMLLLMLYYVTQGVLSRQYAGTIVPGINVILYLYGLHRFLGFRNGASDLVLASRQGLRQLAGSIVAPAPGAARPRFVAGRTLAAVALSGLVIFPPWHFGSSSSDGELVGGAIASQTSGTAAAEAVLVEAPPSPPPDVAPSRPIHVTFMMDDSSPPAAAVGIQLASAEADIPDATIASTDIGEPAPSTIPKVELVAPVPGFVELAPKQSAADPAMPDPAGSAPVAAAGAGKPLSTKTTVSVVNPVVIKPAVVKPAVVKPAVVKPAVIKPAVIKALAALENRPPLPRTRPSDLPPARLVAATVDTRPDPLSRVQQTIADWKSAVAATIGGAARGARIVVVDIFKPGEGSDAQ